MVSEQALSAQRNAVLLRNNVTTRGRVGAPIVMFAHGFGCDQGMFGRILPYFLESFHVVLFDHVGSGRSTLESYDPVKYASLERYASDLIEIIDALEVTEVILVAHSVGAMMAVTAAVRRPELFSKLVLLAPSPSYIDDPATGYVGGLSKPDVSDLLSSLDDNHLAWSIAMAPVVMGNADVPEYADELEQSFCRVDPVAMRTFARVTFLSDVRELLPLVTVPSVILQCSQDALAPIEVGRYLARKLPSSRLVILKATGHVPQVSAPDETARAILDFLGSP